MSNALIMTGGLAAEMTQTADVFCSMQADTPEKQKALFSAMNYPNKKLRDCINMTLNITDVYCETVELVNQETGEVNQAVRIVLIDKEGVSYQSVSHGVFNSLRKLIQIFGAPTWEDGLPITVKQINNKNRAILTLDIA